MIHWQLHPDIGELGISDVMFISSLLVATCNIQLFTNVYHIVGPGTTKSLPDFLQPAAAVTSLSARFGWICTRQKVESEKQTP